MNTHPKNITSLKATTPNNTLGQTVGDRLWLWGHPEGSCNPFTGKTSESNHSPAQGARYLGTPNIFYVPFGNEMDINQCAGDLKGIRSTGLSVESWGDPGQDPLNRTLSFAPLFPNLDRVIIDDFFNSPSHARNWEQYSVAELIEARERAHAAGLSFWVVLYQSQLGLPMREHLQVFDGVSFWFWNEPSKEDYERYSQAFLEMTSGQRRLIGCYLFNFGLKEPASADLVRYQMDRNLDLMHSGEIEGVVLHNNDLQGLHLDAYEEARNWVAQYGSESIQPPIMRP